MQLDGSAILSWLVAAVAGSGLTLGALWTGLGHKLIGHLLEKRLSVFKHQQDQEMEKLRAGLAHFSDRGVRSNEREFQALSGVWEKFVDAYLATNASVIAFHRFPDLSHLSTEEVRDFLQSTSLSDAQQKDVLASSDKNRSFSRNLNLQEIVKAQNLIWDARLAMRKEIFIPADIETQLKTALELLSSAQVEAYLGFQDENRRQYKMALELTSNGEKVFSELRSILRARLMKQDDPK